MIKQGRPCAEEKNPTLSSWPAPSGPWQRINVDFAGPVNGKMFLVFVDAFSKWPGVWSMGSTTKDATVEVLAEAMSRYGVVDTFVSDNGPQFTSDGFKTFCDELNIKHVTTAPYSPMINGLAERFVDTFKRTMLKFSDVTSKNVQRFLMNYRATAHPTTPSTESPAELMFGRKIKLRTDSCHLHHLSHR